jgi:hypothetical protein
MGKDVWKIVASKLNVVELLSNSSTAEGPCRKLPLADQLSAHTFDIQLRELDLNLIYTTMAAYISLKG